MWKRRLPILVAVAVSLCVLAVSVRHYSFVKKTI